MISEIQKNWAFHDKYPMRTIQEKLIISIQRAIDEKYKNIILEAGTGIGKSAIALTIANMNKRAYVLTMTKQLQDQYYDDYYWPITEMIFPDGTRQRDSDALLYDVVFSGDIDKLIQLIKSSGVNMTNEGYMSATRIIIQNHKVVSKDVLYFEEPPYWHF